MHYKICGTYSTLNEISLIINCQNLYAQNDIIKIFIYNKSNSYQNTLIFSTRANSLLNRSLSKLTIMSFKISRQATPKNNRQILIINMYDHLRIILHSLWKWTFWYNLFYELQLQCKNPSNLEWMQKSRQHCDKIHCISCWSLLGYLISTFKLMDKKAIWSKFSFS